MVSRDIEEIQEKKIPFNVDDFRSSLSLRGTTKTNKFSVSFNLPPCFQGDPEYSAYVALNRDFELWCDAADLPGTTQQTIKVRRYGYGSIETVPVGPVFDDVPIRVICDGDMVYWNMFHRWLNKTTNKDSSRGMWIEDGSTPTEISGGNPLDPYETAYQSDYISTVAISVYNDTGKEIRRVVLNQAFPTAVSSVKMDWGDNGEIARFMVNLAIQDWDEARTDG